MHSNWVITKWGDLATLEYGKGLRGYENGAGVYRVFGTNGPIGWHDTALYQGPSVIIGRKGAYRGIHYSADPFFVIDTAFYLKANQPFDMRWAYYQLLTQDINGMDSGSAIPSTSRDSFYQLPVILPPLSEQRRIADVLSSLDDKIELNRQINQTLEQMAQAIFQSWFVDFEPVKAEVAALAEGRDPLRAAMCAISGKADADLDALPRESFDQLAATAALFPEELVESELGEIPAGWEFSTIGQEVSVVGGGTPSTANSEYWDGEFAWVTPRDLSRLSDNVLIDTERRITAEGVRKISSGQLPIGSILLSSRAPIGYLALTMMPVSINQGFIAMVCDKRLPNTYVLQWAFSNLDAIKQRGSGTTFPEISKSNFRPMSVLVPDAQLLAAFQELVWPLYEQVTANIRAITSLANLRDSLLPKLLSGELSVLAVDETGEEAWGAVDETASEKIMARDEAASEFAAV